MELVVEYLINNWTLLVSLFALVVVIIATIVGFFKLPKSVKSERFRKWLLYTVTEAEREMGEGTGELKLLKAYEEFVKRFPVLSLIVPFKSFKKMVDEALAQMRQMLQGNEGIKDYVEEPQKDLIVIPQETEMIVEESIIEEYNDTLECAYCGQAIYALDEFNGEMLCDSCYVFAKEVK